MSLIHFYHHIWFSFTCIQAS